MQVEILEVAGIIPAMQALRLPYSREPRSSKVDNINNITELGDLYIVETDRRESVSKEDIALAGRLVKSGDCEAKAMRGIIAYLRISAPRYFYQEFSTYRVGCECLSSESTMHTIARGVTPYMFDCDADEAADHVARLQPLIDTYNMYDREMRGNGESHTDEMADRLRDMRESQFRRIKRHIPECLVQTRIYAISYQCLRNMWRWRHNHRLPEWRKFCEAVAELPFAERLILTADGTPTDKGRSTL